MGAQPKNRRGSGTKGKRRAHFGKNRKLKWPGFSKDENGNWVISHHVSPHTGKYRDKQILVVE